MYRVLESVYEESTEQEYEFISLSDRLFDFQQKNMQLQENDNQEETEQVYFSTGSNDDLLLQIQVTNNLLSIGIALLFFIFVFMVIQFFIEVIKNNITNFFD